MLQILFSSKFLFLKTKLKSNEDTNDKIFYKIRTKTFYIHSVIFKRLKFNRIFRENPGYSKGQLISKCLWCLQFSQKRTKTIRLEVP